jgi:phosphoribosylglycinamide formyltransferase 1
MGERLKLAVLASGRGSNLVAILEAAARGLPFEVRLLLSDQERAPALERAREGGVKALAIARAAYPSREAHEQALVAAIRAAGAELVVLAGYMRVLSPAFIAAFAGRVLNIHPSLLPELKGLDTHARALAAGAKRHGASVHFVSAELDAGPLIAQASLAVVPGEMPDALAARVHALEHVLYPTVFDWYARGRLCLRDGRVEFDGRPLATPLLLEPAA